MNSMKKEALFAEWVEYYNQKKRTWCIAWIDGTFLWMLSAFHQGNRWENYHSMRDWGLMLTGMCILSFLFSFSYLKCYTQIEGKDTGAGQMIWDVVYRMPFSVEEYYKIVAKSFQKAVSFIGVGIFLLLEAGLFIKITKEKKYWDIQFSHPLSQEFIIQNLLVGVLVVGTLTAVMYLGFFLCKQWNIKYLNDRKKGKEKKVYFAERKADKEKKNEKRIKKRRIIKEILRKDEKLWNELNFSYTKEEHFANSFGVVLDFFGIAIVLIKLYCEHNNIPLGIPYLDNICWLLLSGGMLCNGYGEWRKSRREGILYGLMGACMFVIGVL